MSTDKMPTPSGQAQWMRFASMATQMLGAIAASVWIGYWLDGKTQTSIPWFSITLPVITVIGLLVRIMNDTRPKKK